MGERKGVPDHDFEVLVFEVSVVASALLPEQKVRALFGTRVWQGEGDIVEKYLSRARHKVACDAEGSRHLGTVVNYLGGEHDLVEAVNVVAHDVKFQEARGALDGGQFFKFLVGELLRGAEPVF